MPRILYILGGLIFMSTVGKVLAQFFNVDFALYGPYLLWFMTMAILYGILPEDKKSVFDKILSNEPSK